MTPSPSPSNSPRVNDPARTLAQVADAEVRLRLLEPARAQLGAKTTTLDGGWWPHTRELTLELPLLVRAFAERGLRVTRVVYHPSLWLIAPPKLRVAGPRRPSGLVPRDRPQPVSLRTAQDARIELLVVPPEAAADLAERSMAAAAAPGNHTVAGRHPPAAAS